MCIIIHFACLITNFLVVTSLRLSQILGVYIAAVIGYALSSNFWGAQLSTPCMKTHSVSTFSNCLEFLRMNSQRMWYLCVMYASRKTLFGYCITVMKWGNSSHINFLRVPSRGMWCCVALLRVIFMRNCCLHLQAGKSPWARGSVSSWLADLPLDEEH